MRSILAIIFLIGAILILLLVTWPEYRDLRTSMVEIEIRREERENLINHHQALDEISEKLLKNYKEKMTKLEDGIPDDHYAPSLFVELREISHRSGVRIGSLGDFSFREDEERGISEVEISLSVEGGYSNFKNFVSRLERSARIMNIKDISITRVGEIDVVRPMDYSLTFTAYSY